MPLLREGHVSWLIVWLLMLVGVAWSLGQVRRWVLVELDNDAARAQWRQWKEATQESQQSGQPVRRRPVRADEPPAVILLRDHYPAVLGMCLVIASLLYGFLVLTLQGSLRTSPRADRRTKLVRPTDGIGSVP
jgi:hypothetical protein